MKQARCSVRRLLYSIGVGEATTGDPNKVQQNMPSTIPPNATDVLQRLRDSDSALSEGEVLTGPIRPFWLPLRSL
jgi:hypothetical protein